MFFIDSSDPTEVSSLSKWGICSGVTTNPLILAKAGVSPSDLRKAIQNILTISSGPVSVELTKETEDEMLHEAREYVSWGVPSEDSPVGPENRVCIKVPFSEVGLRVTHALAWREAIPTNVTCVMSFNQAILACYAGATFVSIFSGRVKDMGYDIRPIISQVREQIDREKLSSRIIVGSIRHMMDVVEALQAGAHIVTVPPAILRKMLFNPQTTATIAEFNSAWAKRS